MNMNWHYKVIGTHTHVRVFCNGANCGQLCFRNEEFMGFINGASPVIAFIDDDPKLDDGCRATQRRIVP